MEGDPRERSNFFSHRVVLTATFTGHESVCRSPNACGIREYLRVDESLKTGLGPATRPLTAT